MIIAVDADGGDYASRELVKGAAEAADEYGVDIILVGKKTILDMLVRRYAKKQNVNYNYQSFIDKIFRKIPIFRKNIFYNKGDK